MDKLVSGHNLAYSAFYLVAIVLQTEEVVKIIRHWIKLFSFLVIIITTLMLL